MREREMIAARIEELCQEKGITYHRLGYQSAVPMTTIYNIRNCRLRNPGFFTIAKICDGLGVTVAEFMDSEKIRGLEQEVE